MRGLLGTPWDYYTSSCFQRAHPSERPPRRTEARAAARLECLEESKEKEALLTLVRGVTWMQPTADA